MPINPRAADADSFWLMTDDADEKKDAQIASHIVNTRFKGSSELLVNEGSMPDPTKNQSGKKADRNDGGEYDVLTKGMLRKYVAYAKRTVRPKLNEEAQKALVDFYVQTRKSGGDATDSVAITARALEGLSRLSEASARIRLDEVVNVEDAQRAIRLTKTWRFELMGENFDETSVHSGKKTAARNQERTIHDIVSTLQNQSGTHAALVDVLNDAERSGISRAKAEDIIEKMCRDGRMMRPSGYQTLQLV